MNLTNIAEQVTITVVSAALLWLGAKLLNLAWKKTEQLAAKLKNQYQNNALISPRAQERISRMREIILVACFTTMLGFQIRSTGPALQAWDVVALSAWTWCLLTTLLHIARKK
ncbi:hypothetical protein [Paenacidovorax caeni]|uniref:hypothetical protein n=1 Tax=Paenacidovorax caeni TaxID=343013 RepID=UPI00111429A9|nr:hypothetical protein [Paenacidovorax caeni]